MEYNQSYHKKVHTYLYSDDDYYKLRARVAFLKYLNNLNIKNKKILEFGCGLGQNIFTTKNQSIGYDISKFSLNFCNKKGIKTIDSEKKIPEDYFDLVLSSHVLEHLDNPLDNLKLINKILKNKGYFVLAIPKEPNRRESYLPDKRNYHIYSWNFRTINNLLDKAGFEVKLNKTQYGGGYYKLKFLGKLNFLLYFILTNIIGRIFNQGELIIIAQKK